MESQEVSQEELNELFKVRGEDTLKIFDQVIFSEIENPKLLSILNDVKRIWKDRFRPTLTSLSCEAVGGNPEDTTLVSLMISLGGAGIGIHDDIIDKSTAKGFRKTVLGLHGVEGTLLAGDLLLVKGLTAIKEMIIEGYESQKVVEIINVLKRYYFEICEGVFMESLWRKNIDVELEFCHDVLWKYGSDGEACTRLGAIMGGGTEKEVEALGEYGRRLCYVFRLAEEVKDILLPLKGDLLRRLKFESIPIPILYAGQVSKKNTLILKSNLEEPITKAKLTTLLELCKETKAIKYVNDLAQKMVNDGMGSLNTLQPTKARTFLTLIIRNIFPDFGI